MHHIVRDTCIICLSSIIALKVKQIGGLDQWPSGLLCLCKGIEKADTKAELHFNSGGGGKNGNHRMKQVRECQGCSPPEHFQSACLEFANVSNGPLSVDFVYRARKSTVCKTLL